MKSSKQHAFRPYLSICRQKYKVKRPGLCINWVIDSSVTTSPIISLSLVSINSLDTPVVCSISEIQPCT
jgi:hypothetical protein